MLQLSRTYLIEKFFENFVVITCFSAQNCDVKHVNVTDEEKVQYRFSYHWPLNQVCLLFVTPDG